MKRFHVHVAVPDLDAAMEFYSHLFGQPPAKTKDDYAKWMLDDPAVNFAISSRGHGTGINHLGFQAGDEDELAQIKAQAEAAAPGEVLDQGQTACCYANSEKHWTVDPAGIAWEHFHTMSDAEAFGEDTVAADGACCIPLQGGPEDACCIPNEEGREAGACCG